MNNSAPPAHPVEAGGGLVSRKTDEGSQILLIYRRGVWDLPKGKKEEGENQVECAVREVAEEIGISKQMIRSGRHLMKTYHEYDQEGTLYGKTTEWYAMELADNNVHLIPQKEEQIEELRWVAPEEGKQMVEYENLIRVINAFLQQKETNR